VKDADAPPAQELLRACQEALASALTKFDTLDVYFAAGWAFDAVCDMLIEEVRQDSDVIPPPAASLGLDEVRLLVKRTVGKAFGDWKKVRGMQKEAKRLTPQGEIPLPWASIDAYPDWVVNQVENYLQADLNEKQSARRVLERTLLEKPLIAASIKYDGTCFGKMDDGDLLGRRLLLGRGSTTYQQTSTATAAACDVSALRDRLAEIAGVELGRVCVWGELMCNPGFYSYRERGLHEKWVCFGVVVALKCASESERVAEGLRGHGLAQIGAVHGAIYGAVCAWRITDSRDVVPPSSDPTIGRHETPVQRDYCRVQNGEARAGYRKDSTWQPGDDASCQSSRYDPNSPPSHKLIQVSKRHRATGHQPREPEGDPRSAHQVARCGTG